MKKIAFALCLSLSACTASAVTLVAPEDRADPVSIAQDNIACRQYASELVAARASVPSLGVVAAASSSDEADLYVACMQARGYRDGKDLPPGALR